MTNVKHLLEQFVPANYDISLKIDPEKLTFTGKVVVNGEKIAESKSVSVHSKDLEIVSAKVNGHPASTASHSQEELELITKAKIAAGECQLELEFSGLITETMHGIYQAPYIQSGEVKLIVATQFESHHAREAFPCIDEPMAKATFNLSLTYPTGQVALSNMPVKESSAKAKSTTISFETTPIMSTYLLAFTVGDLKSISTKTERGVEVNVWSTPDNAGYLDFALETSKQGLEFFEEYFAIDYPLPKCDMVAIPSFSSGAMENWGLITYRESALFVDPKNTKLGTKQRIAETIIHELAHQWFGNLVTMKWWSDLWLNEGFASWAANFAVDKLFPEWNYWAQFISADYSLVQSADALPSSRPIEAEINDPDEIRSIFDEISYSKGPVVVRMLQQYLGEKEFQRGISYYIRKNAYKNASTADLWLALEESSGLPVSNFMSAWTSQAGYPFVRMKIKAGKVELEQSRFLLTGKDTNQIWPIPVTNTNTSARFVLNSKSGTWETDVSDYPKFNAMQGSLYMTAYPDDYVTALRKKVIDQTFNEVDRLGLVEDIFQLARAGHGSIIDSLDLVFNLKKEESLVVWETAVGQIANIRKVMDSDELIDKMRPFMKDLAKHNLERLGWEPKTDESSFDSLMRPLVISTAAFGDNQTVIKKAQSMFDAAKKPEDIQPDLRNAVYGVAVRFGDQTTFEKLLSFYLKTESPQEKTTLAGALTGFKQPEIIEQCFDLIKTEVKLQDAGFWFAYSFSNRYAKRMMWDWIKDNWDWVLSKFDQDLMTLSWIPEYSALVFSDKEFLADYKAFWKKNSRKSLEREVAKGIENLTWQIAWRERDFAKIDKYFSKR